MCVFRYPRKREVVKEVHNSVMYKASDVVYDLKHTACSSAESPRLRLIQVQSYVWCCMHTHMISTLTMHPWYIVHSVVTTPLPHSSLHKLIRNQLASLLISRTILREGREMVRDKPTHK